MFFPFGDAIAVHFSERFFPSFLVFNSCEVQILSFYLFIYFILYLTFQAPYLEYTGNECCERLAYYGISTNLVTYLTKKLHQGNVSAARNVTTWQGTCYLAPLIGAITADAYWGRYWTIAAFSTVYFIVCLIWSGYTTPPSIDKIVSISVYLFAFADCSD